MNTNFITALALIAVFASGCQTSPTKSKVSKPVVVREEVLPVEEDDTDTIELPKSYIEVWLEAMDTLKRLGLVTSFDQSKGIIQANIQSAKVTVNIIQAKGNKVSLSVNAMKDNVKDQELAKEILARFKTN